ncbi:MAG: hypothetical protein QY332_06725 [Anaerolineales bacterium]|nr:MAG: hypothetical protein QY332_06725 [Anaerolineales bacterium]
MRMTKRDRWDWSLLIFIVPLGILLMIIAGQVAMQIRPQWSLNAGMGSNLNPETEGGRNGSLPIFNPQILTPFPWLGTFLTPSGDGISYPPLVVINPNATQSPILPTTGTEPPATVTETPVPSPTSTIPVVPPSATPTKKPADDDDDPSPPAPTPTATPTGYPSTLDPSLVLISPAPAQINTDAPNRAHSDLPSGSYTILYNPVIVLSTPDEYYDMVFYEYYTGSGILLDYIIIGISKNADGSLYYEVFNWGDGVPDTNTNVASVPEVDNASIPIADLHPYPDPPAAPIHGGILIDVDTASSEPPADTYDYIVIISPSSGGDPAQIDAIVVTEVPIPTP